MITKILSRQNEKIKELVRLEQESRKSKNPQFFAIEGFHLLEMALEKGVVTKVFSLKEIKNIPNIEQYIVTDEIMEKISSMKNPQGVVAVCKANIQNEITSNKVLYLDDVNDPGNVGTILRTALAFGFKDIILSANSCSIYNEKVIQASQGAMFKLNIVQGNIETLKSLKGYDVLATEIKGSVLLDEIRVPEKLVLVLGNEAHGVSDDILKLANKRVRIDIKEIESLNVAIAGAIAMHYLK